MRTGLEKYFGVRVRSKAAGSPAATAILTGAELERLVVRPWALGQALILDGGQFEPNTYSIEIKPYPGVPKTGENVNRLWSSIIVRDQSAHHLNQAAIDRHRATAAAAEISKAPKVGPRASAQRKWERVRDHNVLSGLLVFVLSTIAVAAWSQLRGSDKDPGTTSTSRGPAGSPTPAASKPRGPMGQILRGDNVRAIVLPDGQTYSSDVKAPVGATVRIATRLSNAGPDDVPAVHVSASLPQDAGQAAGVTVALLSKFAPQPADRQSDTATIHGPSGEAICLTPVGGSANFATKSYGVLERIPDALYSTGSDVGPIPVGSDQDRKVVFDVKVEPATAGSAC